MEVITLSSGSEDDSSDVEFIAQYSNFLSRTDPLSHQDVEVLPDISIVNAPKVGPQPDFNNDLWKVKCPKNSKYGDCYLLYSYLLSLFKLHSQSKSKYIRF